MDVVCKIIMWLLAIIGCGYALGLIITIIVDTIVDFEDWKRNRRSKR